MRRYFLKTLPTVIILALTFPISAICAPPAPGTHPGPNVNINNDVLAVEVTKQLPFCPCFSTGEIDSFLGNNEVGICEDDREAGTLGFAGTAIIADTDTSSQKAVSVEGIYDDNVSSWSCKMIEILPPPSSFGAVVDFIDIGFTNAMACRLAIINSNAWANCPPVDTSP